MDNNPKPQDDNPVVTPEETPTYSNEDLHKESVEEIAKNTEIPEVTPEVTPTVTPETPVTPTPPEEEEIEIEPEQMIEEITNKVVEKMTPAEKEVAKNKYSEFFDKVKAEKGRDPNWIEVSQFLEDQAVERIKLEQKASEEAQVKAKEEENKATEAFTKRFNSQVDEELEELYKSGNLTAIKDAKNPNDQGVVERKALFQAMLDTNAKRANEGKDAILSIARIFYGGYYTKPSAKVAGEEAPISMGKGTPGGGEDEQEIDYNKDIKKPWSFFQKKP